MFKFKNLIILLLSTIILLSFKFNIRQSTIFGIFFGERPPHARPQVIKLIYGLKNVYWDQTISRA